MVQSEVRHWFAVQVIPHHEHKVSSQLRYKGHEEFLPTVAVRHKWSDRNKLIDEPLFPGYLFCRVAKSNIGPVLGTPGVYRIVSFGGHAYPVSDEEIDSLKQLVSCGREISAVPYFSLGQKVQVVEGPLSGLTGIVERLKNRTRLVISVDILMRSVAVDVGISELSGEIDSTGNVVNQILAKLPDRSTGI